MEKDDTVVTEGLGLIERESSVQFWVTVDTWAFPLAIGYVPSLRHLFIQILCFNLSIDFIATY